MRLRLLCLLAAAFLASQATTPLDTLTAAIKEAIGNVALINTVAEDTIGEDQNPHTQVASADSIDAQKIGDVIQETTRILVANGGAASLSQFDGLDIAATLQSLLGPVVASAAPRVKRQYGGGPPPAGGPGGPPPPPGRGSTGAPPSGGGAGIITNGSNPLDTSCIDRPLSCDSTFPYRSISGWCNHADTANRGWGSTMNPFRRFMGAAKYDDGFNSVRRKSAAGGVLPSTRAISNKIFAEASIPAFDAKYNHYLMQYGQWVAHDVVFTPSSVGTNGAALDCSSCESADLTSNCAPIEVPDDDAYFPTKTAAGKKACIRLTRAINGQTGLGPRAQINQNSHFLDLSQVYGSTDCISKELRTLKDGQMIMYNTNGYTLPPRAANDTNCQSQKTSPSFLCFQAGDSRNSLHPGLIPLHTIYLRQHNKWAAEIRRLRPTWSDNLVYHETRRLMIAAYQFHIYDEYLPKIIGTKMMMQYNLNPAGLSNTYVAATNPSISAEFGTAAFRFGHSQARKDLPRSTNQNVSIGQYVDLGQNIFYSDSLYDKSASVFAMAQGMVNSPGMAVDRQFSFPIRHELFATRGKKASGVDLPAVNVQRAREMGVQAYNDVRVKIPGLARVANFDALRNDIDQSNIDLLKKTYASVDDVDLYVGLLMEKTTDPTALLGPTGGTIIADQFAAFKKGDRFFYENTANSGGLTQAEYEAIRNYSLAQMVCENVDGMDQVQVDVFQHNSRKVACKSFQRFPMDQILY